MKSLYLFAVLSLCIYTVHTATSSYNAEVVNYLIDNGYVQNIDFTRSELRKGVRQCQRENNLTVNGSITPEFIAFVKNEDNKQTVIKYLKTYNYIRGSTTPLTIKEAVKTLQKNSGILKVTGVIDEATINFIKNNPVGYSEGLFA